MSGHPTKIIWRNENEEDHDDDVILRVSKKKEAEITYKVVEGQKYILIPINDESKTFINGKEFEE